MNSVGTRCCSVRWDAACCTNTDMWPAPTQTHGLQPQTYASRDPSSDQQPAASGTAVRNCTQSVWNCTQSVWNCTHMMALCFCSTGYKTISAPACLCSYKGMNGNEPAHKARKQQQHEHDPCGATHKQHAMHNDRRAEGPVRAPVPATRAHVAVPLTDQQNTTHTAVTPPWAGRGVWAGSPPLAGREPGQ